MAEHSPLRAILQAEQAMVAIKLNYEMDGEIFKNVFRTGPDGGSERQKVLFVELD
jgi:hypothetical protein